LAGPAGAQSGLDAKLAGRCEAAGLAAATGSLTLCRGAVASAQLLQPELGLLLTGGNPVLGTASPIAKKFRGMPRFQLGGRIGFAWAKIPDVLVSPQDAAAAGTRSFVMAGPQLDLSVGVFDGVALGSTAGGLGAIELLGSVGTLLLPNGEGFERAASGFGLGARVGILREGFTAPGISLTALYKRFGRVQYGGGLTELGLDMEAAAFRAGISKSFIAFGLAFTVAYDSYWSDIDLQVIVPSGMLQAEGVATVIPRNDPIELHSDRWSAFLDVSYIVLFLNLTAELGWQERAALTTSNGHDISSGKLFTAIGLRLTL
jgi:hypothetical protein